MGEGPGVRSVLVEFFVFCEACTPLPMGEGPGERASLTNTRHTPTRLTIAIFVTGYPGRLGFYTYSILIIWTTFIIRLIALITRPGFTHAVIQTLLIQFKTNLT